MAIVPNLNGVQISNQTPLVDPRNLSSKERTFSDDAYSAQTTTLLVNGNQVVSTARQTRNIIMFVNPEDTDTIMYLSAVPMTVAGQGIPLYPGNGFTFRGKAAQLAYYVWGVAGQYLVVMEG